MTAGIFAKHGVWVGNYYIPGNRHNAKGEFENSAIRKVVARMQKGLVALEGRVAQPLSGFKTEVLAILARQGYVDGAWLYKGSALQWPAFYEFRPKWVCCKRPVEQIFSSCRSSGIFGRHLNDARLKEIIALHYEQMDRLKNEVEVFEVDTYEVVQGNYGSVELALKGCGIEPVYALIDDFVDSSLWRHR